MTRTWKKVVDLTRGKGEPTIGRSMALLTIGSVLGRIVGIVTLPIITRIYEPDSFGLLAVYTAIVGFLIPPFSLYSLAVPLPKRQSIAINVVAMSLIFLSTLTAALTVILCLFAIPLLSLISAEGLAPYWYLIIIGVFGGGLYEVLSQWATRTKAFKQLAISSITQAVWSSASQVALGLAGFHAFGLLLGGAVRNFAGSIPMMRAMREDCRGKLKKVKAATILKLFWIYYDFPASRLWSQLLLAFSSQALLLFSAAIFGIYAAGQINLAMLVAALPLRLVGASVGRAYYAEAAAIGRKDKRRMRELAISVVKKLAIASVPPCVVIFFFGESLFAMFFGEKWRMAGSITSYMAPYVATSFISVPVFHTLNVIGKQLYYLRVNITRAMGTACLLGLAYYIHLDAVATTAMYSILLSVHFIAVLWTILRMLR